MKTGDVIEFGEYDWRVLDVCDSKALIVSDKITVKKEYGYTSSWKDCDLRLYLNEGFYSAFTEQEKLLISEARVKTGDSDTVDKLFILSIEEVVLYFGDSGQYLKGYQYIYMMSLIKCGLH